MKLLNRSLAILLLSLLAGCGSVLTEGTGDLAGVAGAGVAGAVSRNAAVGAAIGLGVRSVANAGLQFEERRVHRTEQDRIAAVAGALPVGSVAPWNVVHDIPIEDDEHGEVVVARALGAGAIDCKEIVFSVDEAKARAFYTATVCRDGTVWKWASAEPATERWGSLQ